MYFIKILVYYFSFVKIFSQATEYCNYIKDEKNLVCENFSKFDDLNSDLEKLSQIGEIKKFKIRPKVWLKLEEGSIQLQKIVNSFIDEFDVILEKIDGFNFIANPFSLITKKGFNLELNDVKLSFFDRQEQDLRLNCNLDKFASEYQIPIFSKFEIVNFNQNVTHQNSFCPILFQRSITKKLIINDVGSIFSFSTLTPSSENRTLKSDSIIEYQLLNTDKNILDQTLLSNDLFGNLEKFSFKQSESSETDFQISSSIFKNFTKLKEINIELNNFETFYKISPNSLDWIYDLNKDSQKNKFRLILKDNGQIPYEYPDDDFCLFSKFPHQNSIFPIIKYNESFIENYNCSCTFLWLNKNYQSFDDQNIYTDNDTALSRCLSNFEELYNLCNITSKLDFCKSLETTRATTKSTTPTKITTTFPFGFQNVSNSPIKKDNTNTYIFIPVGILGTIFLGFLFTTYILRSRKRISKKKLINQSYYNNDEVNIVI